MSEGLDIGSCLFESVCVSSKYLSSSSLDAQRRPEWVAADQKPEIKRQRGGVWWS
ncbi:UNVERIFIED_CONTAM: hypothetical protein FKN15_048528 [Acipenser sinensis]